MARYAIVEDGVVTNVVEGTSEEATKYGWIVGDGAEIGGTYNGSEFTKPAAPTLTEDEARTIRNNLLSDTDWWAVKDRTMTQTQKDYRTALRDLPDDADWPNMDWPTKP